MAFSDFATDLQTITLYNYDVFIKAFLFISIIGFSLFYLFVWRPRQKATPLLFLGVLRFKVVRVKNAKSNPAMMLNIFREKVVAL